MHGWNINEILLHDTSAILVIIFVDCTAPIFVYLLYKINYIKKHDAFLTRLLAFYGVLGDINVLSANHKGSLLNDLNGHVYCWHLGKGNY